MADYLATNEVAGTGAIMTVNIDFKGVDPDVGSGAVPYINAKDIKAQIVTPASDTASGSVQDIGLTYIGPTTFRTNVIVPRGKTLRVYRASELNYGLVQFQALQNVTEQDLDLMARQVLYVAMETRDAARQSVIASQYSDGLARLALGTASAAVTTAASAVQVAAQATSTAGDAVRTANSAVATAKGSEVIAQNALAGVKDSVTAASAATAAAQQATRDAAAAVSKAMDITQEATGRFLAPRTVNPALRDNGSPLQIGDRYLNTTTGIEFTYQANGWVANNLDGAALANNSDPNKGATLVGFDGGTVADALRLRASFTSYSDVRGYIGSAVAGILINGAMGGELAVDALDSTTQDNGWSVFVDARGRRWKRMRLAQGANAEWFGVESGKDCTDSLQRAYDALCGTGITLLLPTGEFGVSCIKGGRLTGSLTIKGQGRSRSVIKYDNYASSSNHMPVLYTNSAVGSNAELVLQDFGIEGLWGKNSDYTEQNSLVSVFNFKKLRATGMKFSGSRSGGLVAGNLDHTFVFDCDFEKCYRDPCRIANSVSTIILACRGIDGCDDGFAVTNDDSNPIKQTLIVVQGCVLTDSQGIAALGAKVMVLLGNIIVRPIHRGIITGQAEDTFAEGHTAGTTLIIEGNQILDGFSGTLFSPKSGSGFIGIHVSGKPFLAKDTVATGVNGKVVAPWPYLYTKGTDAPGAVNAGMNYVSIKNNHVVRTLPAVDKYSDYGFGPRLSRSGYVDPPVRVQDMADYNLRITSGGFSLDAVDNVFSGAKVNVCVDVPPTQAGVCLRDWTFRNNALSLWSDTGLRITGSGHVRLHGNRYNGDPYQESALRTATGGWTSGFLAHSAIHLVSPATQLTAELYGESFKNCGIPVKRGFGESYTGTLLRDNVLHCYPTTTGYGAANGGIGFIPRASNLAASVIVEDYDPSSPTFGQVLNVCPNNADAMPTSGIYLWGTFVYNNGPGTVMGWYRATNGDKHVLGTDWIAR